jgi:hypothetical protein
VVDPSEYSSESAFMVLATMRTGAHDKSRVATALSAMMSGVSCVYYGGLLFVSGCVGWGCCASVVVLCATLHGASWVCRLSTAAAATSNKHPTDIATNHHYQSPPPPPPPTVILVTPHTHTHTHTHTTTTTTTTIMIYHV